MRDPRTHERALRAALQVARGNRKQAAAALTGVAMLTGCGSGDDSGTDTTGDSPPVVDGQNGGGADAVQSLVDAMDAAASEEMDGATSQEMDGALSQEMDMVAVQEAGPSEGDVAEQDAMACIDSCWQPNGTECTVHSDCNVPEVLGTCEVTGTPCNWGDQACPDGELCEDYEQAKEVYLNPETGEPYEFNTELKCMDGMCHEGDSFSAAAQACCGWGGGEEESLPWCDELAAPMPGCTPWGPPAPPAHDGTTLAQRMERWLS